MLQGKKILLGVTGSIAAYKSALLVRLLVKAGAEVKVVMTPSATDFITPLTLSTLSKHPVVTDLFHDGAWSNHVMLGRWADLIVVAPASCNTLAKMTTGICDNALLATYLSATCPVMIAPAMDEDMWLHPSTTRNIALLKTHGNAVMEVGSGDLASGLSGPGRMPEPEEIIRFITDNYFAPPDLSGRRALVTAGPTYEPLDPVRFIGNHSSGKMGVAVARELAARGANVVLVAGPGTQVGDKPRYEVVRVGTAAEMFQACETRFDHVDIAVMAAAVADYTPASPAQTKIKKQDASLMVELTKTVDILKTLGGKKRAGQVLAGFALETDNEEAHAREKLKAKNADLIVLNSLNDPGAGFGFDTNKVTFFDRTGARDVFEQKSKQQVAKDIVDRIVKLLHA